MARLLVQLKLRLLTNALRSSTSAKASFITSTIFAVLVALGTFAGLAALRGHREAVALTSVVFTVFAFGWLIVPMMAFGLDATLDPATLSMYPLRTRPLAAGLLAASATGAWPVANVLGLLGVTVGLAHGPVGVLIAVLAVVLQVLFCIALARLVTTGLARVLRSRRGRDFAAFLLIPIVALYEFFTQVVPRAAATGKVTAASFNVFDSWMRWLPPGMAAHAIKDASDGRIGVAITRLLVLAAVSAVLGWLWVRSLNHALVTADISTQASEVHGVALPFPRAGLRGTVAARTWLYQRRNPTSIVYWGIIGVATIAASVSSIRTPHYLVAVFLSAGLGPALVAILNGDAIGFTGPAFGLDALALTGRRDLRAWFSGLNIVFAMIAAPLLAALSFGVAAVAGHPADGFAALAVDLAGIGAAMGLIDVFSVTLAYPAERRAGSPVLTAASGYAGYRVATTFGSLIGVGAAVTPVVIVALNTGSDPGVVRFPLLVLCAAAYGLALAWAGVRIAARAADNRLPELCQVAIRSKL